ncbi:HD domain-containing protein [bacterium]|nr:MAG: HD domain-containing protein [bacterium]
MTVAPETSPELAAVREFAAGDRVTGFYLVTKLETKPKKDGSLYLLMELQDSSGHLDAKMWEGFESIYNEAKAGDVVKVAATLDRYRDQPGLIISKIRLATEDEVPNRRAYFPHSALSAVDASLLLDEIIDSISDVHLKTILEAVFGDGEFRTEFLESPGGKQWHHSTLGGLAEHTISLAKLADKLCEHYAELNRDLLITGTLLHDVGKVFELNADVNFDYTTDGRLLGHIVQGTLFVEKKISELSHIPAETRKQVLHLILSHQGSPEMGSPVKPLTLEGIVLHYLDDLDAKVNAFAQVKAKTPDGEDFSGFIKLMERFFYFKPLNGDSNRSDDE